MKTYNKFIIVTASSLAFPMAALAGDYATELTLTSKPAKVSNYYFEVLGGASFSPDLDYDGSDFEMDSGHNYGASFGKSITDRLDVEVEAFYTESGYKGFDTNVNSLALNLNVIYNFPVSEKFTPYLGAGIGATLGEYDGEDQFPTFTGDEWRAGFNAVAGVRYLLTEKLDLFAELRYSDTFGDIKAASANLETKSYDVSLGLRFKF